MKASLTLYGRLLRQLAPYRGVVALSIAAMVATAALEPLLPAMLKPLVDESLIGRDETAQWRVPLLLMLIFLAKGVADYVASVSSQWVAQKTVHDLRTQVFAHQLTLPLPAHQAQGSGRMASRILHDIPQVASALSSAWIVVIRDSLVIVGLSAFLLWTAWELALLLLAIVPAVGWLIRQASRKLRATNLAIQRTTGEMTGTIGEALNGVQEIKVFGAEKRTSEVFNRIAERLRKENMRTVRVASANSPLVQLFTAAGVALVLWIASGLSAHDRLTPGEFVSFVAAMAMLFSPLRRLTNVNSVIQRGLAGAQSIFELLDQPIEALDSDAVRDKPALGSLRFEAVSFCYPKQAQPALENFSVDIRPGMMVALVGTSGGGKSTVLQLLARFYRPDSGAIHLDGAPLDTLPLAWLRAQISWVGQHSVLFDTTIAENIALSTPQASEADIRAAAEAADALGFIEALADGMQTQVGANGSRLSGGQRQRIALARAFLKPAPIVLLDEATSALDNHTDHSVGKALAAMRGRKTLVVVAHRLSTIRSADLILVMNSGRVVERGTHDALIDAGGAYARLVAAESVGNETGRQETNASTSAPELAFQSFDTGSN